MYKSKLILTVLLAAAILALFGGCQVQNFDIPTEPSAFSQPTEPTDPSSKPTTETVCPRTIEYFKSHLTPFMLRSEAIGLFGSIDYDESDSPDWRETIWVLDDGYFLIVEFYPTASKRWIDYVATAPTDETTPDGILSDYYLNWFRHMEAYRAILYKGDPNGKREQIEIWFDYGYGPFWKQEE